MKPLFADTSYYLALLSESDVAHDKAVEIASAYKGMTVTTAWVLAEVADAFAEHRQRGLFIQLYERLRIHPRVMILPASEELFARGITFYARYQDKDWSLTDCISFLVMSDWGVTEALTGDHHFEQAGFRALLK